MHENSLEAHDRLRTHLNNRERMILEVYRKNYPTPISDRFVMTLLGFTDPNFVRPRISSLKKKNLIVETGKVVCRHSGMRARHCRLATEFPQLELVLNA